MKIVNSLSNSLYPCLSCLMNPVKFLFKLQQNSTLSDAMTLSGGNSALLQHFGGKIREADRQSC